MLFCVGGFVICWMFWPLSGCLVFFLNILLVFPAVDYNRRNQKWPLQSPGFHRGFLQSILFFKVFNISFHQWGMSSSEKLSTLLNSVCPAFVRARKTRQGSEKPPVFLSFWMPISRELVLQPVTHWWVIIEMRVSQKGNIRIYKAFYCLKGEVNIHHVFREPLVWQRERQRYGIGFIF